MFRDGGQPVISFVTDFEPLTQISDCVPKPAKEFKPDWWKETPTIDKMTGKGTIKACPALPDYFFQGYIIPMWADTIIRYEKASNTWAVHSGVDGDSWNWEVHENEQALNYFDMTYQGKKASLIFKAISPWKVITKPGWSVYQQPLFYHFKNDFTVLPGVIDTDVHHVINQQVLYFGDGEEILIKRGQPFVQYIPFQRTKASYDVRYQTRDDEKRISIMSYEYESKIANPLSGVYRKMQRSRDKCPITHK